MVRHNAVSASLVTLPGALDYLGLGMEELASGCQKLVESLRLYPGSSEPGHSGLMLASRIAAVQACSRTTSGAARRLKIRARASST